MLISTGGDGGAITDKGCSEEEDYGGSSFSGTYYGEHLVLLGGNRLDRFIYTTIKMDNV